MIDVRCLRDQTDRLYLILKGSRYKNKATPKFPQQMIKTANERESQMILSAFPFFCESPCACVRHSSRYVFCSYLVLLEPYSMVKNQDCYRYEYMKYIRSFPQGPTGTTCTLLLWWPTQELCALLFSFSKDLPVNF